MKIKKSWFVQISPADLSVGLLLLHGHLGGQLVVAADPEDLAAPGGLVAAGVVQPHHPGVARREGVDLEVFVTALQVHACPNPAANISRISTTPPQGVLDIISNLTKGDNEINFKLNRRNFVDIFTSLTPYLC